METPRRRVAPTRRHRGNASQRFALSIISLGTGIPITAIAAEAGGILGITAAWIGIVGVNVADAIRRD